MPPYCCGVIRCCSRSSHPRHHRTWSTIGIPASLAPNNERSLGFVRRVMTSAVPFGLVIGVATFVTYLAAYQGRYASWQEQGQ